MAALPPALNVGSGKPVSLEQVANRILELCQSRSAIHRSPARAGEVDRFVADVRLAAKHLRLSPQGEPLGRLDEVVSKQI
jgi:UDP-glucose 4-epimerase